MGRTKALIACAMTIATCGVADAWGQEVRDGYWPKWGIRLEEVHQSVLAEVFDHRSAQYRGLDLVPVENGNVLCGWVTWRGDDGEFVRWTPFYFKAAKGGVRDWLLADPATTISVPIAFESAGCDPVKMMTLQRGHRAP